MNCPKCKSRVTVKNCVDTRENEIYRKRVCDQCGHVFYTVEYEVVVNDRFKKEWQFYNKLRRKSYSDAKQEQ